MSRKSNPVTVTLVSDTDLKAVEGLKTLAINRGKNTTTRYNDLVVRLGELVKYNADTSRPAAFRVKAYNDFIRLLSTLREYVNKDMTQHNRAIDLEYIKVTNPRKYARLLSDAQIITADTTAQ